METSGSSAGSALGSGYLLGPVIGRGGMGQVHSGTRRGDGSAVAIKVLRPELAEDPTTITRFVQERSILLAIDSPHVVRVHDLVVEGDRLAIVMDLVEGADLRSYLNQRRNLAPAEAASLVADILAGLQAIHGAGVIHRDLKPENVLLDLSAPAPVARVTDFGIARLSSGPTLTRMTGAMGTPEYLPPEVAAGAKSGPAADVYSAGIIAYELVAGRTPFAGGHLMAVLMRHREMEPVKPDGIPATLWSIISSMLSKAPAERPSVADARDALRAAAGQLGGVPPIAVVSPLEGVEDTPPVLDRLPAGAADTVDVDDDLPGDDADKLTLPGIRTLPPIAAAEAPEPRTGRRRRRMIGVAVGAVAAVGLASVVFAATLRPSDGTQALSTAAAGVTSTTAAAAAPTDVEPAPEALEGPATSPEASVPPAAAPSAGPRGTTPPQAPQATEPPASAEPDASATTAAPPTTAPPTTAAPVGPQATSMAASRTGDRQVTANWSVSPGSGAATCVLYFSGSAKWQGSCSGSMSKTIGGLAYSTTYSIYAKATTAYGSSSTNTVSVRTNDAPPPPPAISLSRGAPAQYGYWYSVVLSNFTPGSRITVSCHDSRDQNFYSQTFTIDSGGRASDSTLCYSGDGPEHWVTGGGVSSNRVSW